MVAKIPERSGNELKKSLLNSQTFSNNEVEEERIRIREIMKDYDEHSIYNYDESIMVLERNIPYIIVI